MRTQTSVVLTFTLCCWTMLPHVRGPVLRTLSASSTATSQQNSLTLLTGEVYLTHLHVCFFKKKKFKSNCTGSPHNVMTGVFVLLKYRCYCFCVQGAAATSSGPSPCLLLLMWPNWPMWCPDSP